MKFLIAVAEYFSVETNKTLKDIRIHFGVLLIVLFQTNFIFYEFTPTTNYFASNPQMKDID